MAFIQLNIFNDYYVYLDYFTSLRIFGVLTRSLKDRALNTFKNPSESSKVLSQGERPMGEQDTKAQVSQLAPNPCFSLISNDCVLGSTGRSKPNSQITTKGNN